MDKLTNREKEILSLVADGLLNKEIAYELHISEKTVKNHLTSIYGKLGVTCRIEAIGRHTGREVIRIL